MIDKTQTLRRLPRRGTTMVAALAMLVGAPSGCATRDDPRFNRYRAPDTAATLMQHLERGMDAVEELLDNLDAHMENVIR